MKKITKKFGLSLAALACVACAGVGVSLSSSNSAIKADAAVAKSDFWIASTGIRLVNDANGSGIRFHTNVTTAVYSEIVESGTLIIPEVRCDGELTLDDLNNADERTRPVQVVTKDANTDLWYTFEYTNEDGSTEDLMRSTVYLYELPESMYGARMVAVSYVTTAEGTTYTEIPSATSMSDVASKIVEGSQYYNQAQPYVIDDVTVKYVMPDGSVQTETVAYGSKVSGPSYNKESYAISATDQYEKAIDFSNYEATLPVTIDVELTAKPKTTAVAGQLIKGLYGATAPERAWSNGPNGTAVAEGIPSGYSSMIRLDWYQQSTSQWVAGTGTNPLYRSQFNQNDISAYDRVTFAMKLETNGDAYVAARNKAVNFGNNKWLYFELIQTSANVWTLTITDDAGTELYKVTDAKADTKTNGSGLSNDYDSVASLVFSRTGYNGAQGGTGWQASHMLALYPCTSQEMTASVYFTEILGYTEDTRAIPSDAITVADAVALTGTTNPNFAIVDNTEEAPAFFNNVTAFKSEQQWGGSYILGSGDFTAVNVKNYSEVWFAVKMVNGCITETAPAWKDVDSYTTSPWIYFHLIQQDNTMTDTSGNPTAAWTIEIIKDGVVWDTLTDQHANANDTIGRILDWSNDSGRIVFYQNRNNLSEPTYLYSTEVKGILKDGVTPPSSGSTETTTAMDIPTAAKGVRNYVWRDDRYALTAHANVTMAAPEGYSYVIEDVWNNHHTNITNQYTFAMDESLDVTAYSDLYFAMKIVDGTRIYVANNTSGAHYTGTDWLYIHYHQESTGVWSYDVASPDGYSAASKSTISATTIKGLIDGKIYGVRDTVDMTTTKTYFTEVRGIPLDDTPWGDRVIWSAIDGARFADEYIAIPAGFTALYRYDGMSVTDAKCNFAAMDLSNTIYEEIRFGFINSDDFSFKAGYTYVGSDSVARNTTTIASHQGDWPKMNVVTLTKNNNGSWHVTIECKRWFDTADTINGIENQKMTEAPFEADVTANSLSAIMSTFMYSNGTKANVAYCTEVRGTHTCAYNNTKSLGNGYLQDYCICGETIGDPYEFAHGIADETVMVKDSIWRANNYALSTPDQVAPAGFNNIEMYRWNLNSVIVNGVPYGSTAKDMPLTCLDEADVSDYSEVWFAMKNVGGTGFYVRNASKYTGNDWLYYHLVKVDGAWTLSLSSPDGYVAENVQTGIVGNTLKDILQYHAKTGEQPWDSGAYPTKADGDTTTDVRIYFTEILGIIDCDHTAGVNYVSNGDGTHNEVCSNCATVITEDVTCSGGAATCTAAAVCSLCETAYGEALGHKNTTWSWGKEICGVCGETVGTAVKQVSPLTMTNTAQLTVIDASSIAKADHFEEVYGVTGGTAWVSSNLPQDNGNYNKDLNLSGYSEVWYALKLSNAKLVFVGAGKADIAGTAAAPSQWVYFHMTQNADATWNIEVTYNGASYVTLENQIGSTIRNLLFDGGYSSTDGKAIVLYQHSGTPCNVYSTEMLCVFETGISSYATNVWDHIWNPYYFTGGGQPEGAWSNEAAPAGFDKVSEYSWTPYMGNDEKLKLADFPVMGHFNASDISAYSDLWFAMKAVNADIYVQGAAGYTGGDWVYVHYHQNSDGSWIKDYRSVDGYFNNTSQVSGNITGTKLTEMISWKSGINQGSYPNNAKENVTATGYFTNVIGVLKCDGTNHGNDVIVSNGDGTHTVSCRCGVVVSTNAPCSGGEATCLHGAICSACGYEYAGATDHTGGEATCEHGAICTVCGTEYTEPTAHNAAWDGNSYVCSVCDEVVGSVTTNLSEVTDVALFTNATYAEKDTTETGAFDATVATPANIDLSGFVDGLTISSISNVALNGEPYAVSSLANNVLTINVIPFDVYGEYTLTATITVEGKDFEVEMPILVITDLITSNAGLLNVRKVLRGPDSATYTASATYSGTEIREFGGKGGIGTMHGMGYYKLGANITMSEIIIGEKHTEDYTQQLTYVFGTPTLPFTGTFDGAGYILNNYKSVKSSYNTPTIDGVATRINLVQDVSQVTEKSAGTTYENEPSLFGYMNGLVKNLAITNAQFGQYGNIVLAGTGVMEDVYVDVANLQATRYNSSGENLSAIVAPLLQRANGTNMTLRNVVIDLNDAAFSGTNATISTHYPSLIGNGFGAAQNVGVYGFDTAWINGAGLGNVLRKNDVSSDGSAVGIYVEYRAGNANATNGARSFMKIALNDNIWKIVDGMPYLKNVSVSGTVTAPSDSSNIIEGSGAYNLVWNDTSAGAFDAMSFINNTTDAAIADGALGANVANLSGNNWSDTKQIIVGSYENYARYLTSAELGDINYNGLAYGVYKVGNTIFVLAESEEGLMLAAKEFCRQLYNYNQYTYVYLDQSGKDNIYFDSVGEIDVNAIENYTTYITFAKRNEANTAGNGTGDMGFNSTAVYTDIVSMHNAANFFGVHADSEATSKDVTELLASLDNWSYGETATFATTSGGAIPTDDNSNKLYQVCYTAHGNATTYWAMIDRVVEVIKAKKALYPNMTMANFMVEDNVQYCQCSTCGQFSSPSVAQLLFLNSVQRELDAQGVGVGIEFFAYNAYSKAPVLTDGEMTKLNTLVNTLNGSKGAHQTITVSTTEVTYPTSPTVEYTISLDATVMLAADGLRLWWTTHEMNHSFPMDHEANAHIYPSLIAWTYSIGAGNIDVFMYQATYRDYFIPLNTWEYQVTWYQQMHKLGITSYMFNLGQKENEANAQTGFAAFKMYIDSRAMTDVNVTFAELKDEFFGVNGYYGAGGPTMRTFFEELVAVYESRKQGSTNAWLNTTSDNVKISTTGGTTGYIASWIYNANGLWYSSSSFSNYYACLRQGFFNGSYAYDHLAILHGAHPNNQTFTPSAGAFKGNYDTELKTLEAWYIYCQTAFGMVDENSKYAKRIKLEALFPEYVYLISYSKYKGATSTTAPSVTPTFPTSSTVIGTASYQDFYNRVKALGILKPAEFYAFNNANKQTLRVKDGAVLDYYIYQSMWANWGITP